MPPFSTAVIGGGAAGIAATLALRQAGSMVTCFETAPTVGGLWNVEHADAVGAPSPLYSSMRCVLPKDYMSFSDHQFPYLVPTFPHHSAVKEYLQDLAVKKGVHSLTRYNTRVVKLEWVGASYAEWERQYEAMQQNLYGNDASAPAAPPLSSSGSASAASHNAVVISGVSNGRQVVPMQRRRNFWRLRSANIITGDVHDWTFDSVVIATGRHHRPRYPGASRTSPFEAPVVPIAPLPGQLAFAEQGGAIGHSSELKRFRDYTGKTVVVVGNGIGAMEHVAELQRHGAFVLHSEQSVGTVGGGEGEGEGEAGAFQPSRKSGDLSLPSRRFAAAVRQFAERRNRLNETRLLQDLLHRRNERSRISMSAFFGQESNVTAEDNPSFGVDSKSLAAQFSYDPELIGKYMPVPTVGDIVRFESGRDVILRIDRNTGGGGDAAAASKKSKRGGFLSLSRAEGDTYPLAKFLDRMTRRLQPAAREKILHKLQVDRAANTVRVTDVDAVIFATGYFRDFSFCTDLELRSALEGVPIDLSGYNKAEKKQQTTTTDNTTASAAAEAATAEPKSEEKQQQQQQSSSASTSSASSSSSATVPLYHDMFMGTLYRKNPTLGVLGLQSELLPPFLLFEAQSRFVASVFSRRVALPPTQAEMTQTEADLLGDGGAALLASPHGCGIGASAALYNGLQRLSGYGNSAPGYYQIVSSERRYRYLGSAVVRFYAKMKSLRPQTRKKQHWTVSNEI